MSALQEGAVVRYQPDPSRHSPTWCREGTAVINDQGAAFDTYWGSGSDSHRLTSDELATAEVLFLLEDFDELDRHAHGTKDKWETYHPDDRRLITSQHGLQRRYFIRKGADPSLTTQIDNARRRLDEAHEELASAARRVEWAAVEWGRLLDLQRAQRDVRATT